MWPWVVVVVLGFFLLGLLGSDGGSVSGYSGGSVSDLWCLVGYVIGCGLVKLQRWRDRDERHVNEREN